MKSSRPEPPDEELMLAYGAGQEEAFVKLFERYNARIFNYLLRHLGDRARAEDLLQETFLRVHSHRKSYRPSAAFSTWIFTIATNLLRDSAVASRRRAQVIQAEASTGKAVTRADSSEPVAAHTAKSAEEACAESEMAFHIRKAVQALPSDQREVILLAKYEGLTFEEIAHILNITANAAKVRAHRAMNALEKILRERFGELRAALSR